MPLTIVNLISIITGVLGLIVVALMLFSYRSKILSNVYLAVFLLFCSILNIVSSCFNITDYQSVLILKRFVFTYIIAAPLVYLYFKALFLSYNYISKKSFVHLIFPLTFISYNFTSIYFPYLALKSKSQVNIQFYILTAYNASYLILIANTLYKHLWKKENSYAIEKRHFKLIKYWSLLLFTITTFILYRSTLSFYYKNITDYIFIIQNYLITSIIPILIIYCKIIINPEILCGFPNLIDRITKIKSAPTAIEHIWIFNAIHLNNQQEKRINCKIERKIIPYISAVENFVNTNHPFRNRTFNFFALSKSTNIPTSQLYYIFKYHAIVNFKDYKNYCRIKDAISLINNGYLNSKPLQSLTKYVGFTSYHSFDKAFKKHFNSSINEFITRKDNTIQEKIKIAL